MYVPDVLNGAEKRSSPELWREAKIIVTDYNWPGLYLNNDKYTVDLSS